MTLALDSSATLAWPHGEEQTPVLEARFDRIVEQGAVVPRLWHLEVANGLTMAVRRRRIAPAYREEALSDLAQLDIAVDAETERHAWKASVRLADLHGLTVYDAAYLELAQRRRLPLATLDAALGRAAQAAGVQVVP